MTADKEVLQMKAEFLKDENGNIWFYYASGIQSRARYKAVVQPVGFAEAAGRAKAASSTAEEKEKI